MDGLSTIELFYIASVIPTFFSALPALTKQSVIKLSIINTVASGIGYYIEALTLKNHGMYSYAEGGAAEYLSKYAIITLSNFRQGIFYYYDIALGSSKFALEAILGALNHVEYALCDYNDKCKNDKPTNIIVAMNIEAIEMLSRELLNDILEEQKFIGAVIGLLEAVNSIYLLPEATEISYQIVDYIIHPQETKHALLGES